MKILELCLSPSLGGLELYMVRTAKVLSETESVLSVISDAGRLRSVFEKKGLPFSTERCLFRFFPMIAAMRLARVIDARDIDVVHMHWGKDLPLAALSKWFSRKKPRLIYTRQMKMTRSKDDFYHNFLYRQMDLMLAITDNLVSEVKRYLDFKNVSKVKRLYYGVETPSRLLGQEERQKLRRAFEIDDSAFLVGLFGRIEQKKGQHLLLEALNDAVKHDVAMAGLIVGHTMEDTYLQGLKRSAKRQGATQNVFFKDFVDDPQKWMQVCDCVVLTTDEETFGLVLVEAMQVGVPVVGSNSGGVPEIIEEGKSGFLFPPGNSAQLYQCLLRLKENASLRKSIADAGQEKAKKLFSTERHYRTLREYMKG